jgi:hypothetical protein
MDEDVGVVPSDVKKKLALFVAQEIVTDCALVYVPSLGLNVGVWTGAGAAASELSPPHATATTLTNRLTCTGVDR